MEHDADVSSQGSESTHGAVGRAEVTDFEYGGHEFRPMTSRILDAVCAEHAARVVGNIGPRLQNVRRQEYR